MLDPGNGVTVIDRIRETVRRRRYAMKLQQKIDRALESFVRLNETDWLPTMSEKERAAIARQVKQIIDAARAGEGEPEIVRIVTETDASRAPADQMRADYEKMLAKYAIELPVFAWVESVRGVGPLGLAIIIGETGPLDRYAGPAKVWKRLGFAPYDGLAGSTWKRDTWRPRALTSEEWIANPFSGERYAHMHQIATWLVNAQIVGAGKTEDGVATAKGPYGEIYVRRRAHTTVSHPDWTKAHSHKDALRIAMKAFLRDLWRHWNGKTQ